MFSYISLILLYFIVVDSVLDYGDFNIIVRDYKLCKGPKRKTCVSQQLSILNNSIIQYNWTVEENMGIIRGKLSSSLQDQELLRLQFKDVCDHIFVRPLLESLFNRCGLIKGNYLFNIDIHLMAQKFYGGKFIYGNWTTKMQFYTDYCNVHCGVLGTEISPKRMKI